MPPRLPPSVFLKICKGPEWATYESMAIRRVHDHQEEMFGPRGLPQVIPRPLGVNGKTVSLVRAQKDLYQHTFEEGAGKRLTDSEQFKIIRDLQLGVFAIHSSSMVHNDIKPENVLLSSSGHWQIADFESATCSSNDYNHPLLPKNSVLTTPYYSPRVLNRGHMSTANDMWAIGVTMHVIRYGSFTPGEHAQQKDNNEAWQYVLDQLLHRNPEKRITAKQLGHVLVHNCDSFIAS